MLVGLGVLVGRVGVGSGIRVLVCVGRGVHVGRGVIVAGTGVLLGLSVGTEVRVGKGVRVGANVGVRVKSFRSFAVGVPPTIRVLVGEGV